MVRSRTSYGKCVAQERGAIRTNLPSSLCHMCRAWLCHDSVRGIGIYLPSFILIRTYRLLGKHWNYTLATYVIRAYSIVSWEFLCDPHFRDEPHSQNSDESNYRTLKWWDVCEIRSRLGEVTRLLELLSVILSRGRSDLRWRCNFPCSSWIIQYTGCGEFEIIKGKFQHSQITSAAEVDNMAHTASSLWAWSYRWIYC